MKIDTRIIDGVAVLVLSDVFSGIAIDTDVGLFGIAQRDGGIEVMLNRKIVWARGLMFQPDYDKALRDAQTVLAVAPTRTSNSIDLTNLARTYLDLLTRTHGPLEKTDADNPK